MRQSPKATMARGYPAMRIDCSSSSSTHDRIHSRLERARERLTHGRLLADGDGRGQAHQREGRGIEGHRVRHQDTPGRPSGGTEPAPPGV